MEHGLSEVQRMILEMEGSGRLPCDDDRCTGTIDEEGVCNICGKRRGKPTTTVKPQQNTCIVAGYPSSHKERWGSIVRGVLYFIVGVVSLGVFLFIGLTFVRAGWKFIKWAWE